jgi:hypothetical protein
MPKYTGQHAFDVGDVPGHQIRIFELRRTLPDNQPNCEGLKLVEQWLRGYSDYVDRNGPSWGYAVTMLENGDKIFAEFSSAVQTVVSPDGLHKTEATTVHKWTGGTGKYQGVRGIQRESTVFDPDKNFNENTCRGRILVQEIAEVVVPHFDGSFGSWLCQNGNYALDVPSATCMIGPHWGCGHDLRSD